jgi:putative endonuclease
MSRPAYVYIMTNMPFGTLYVGVTADLVKRAWEHKEGLVSGFTKTRGLKRLAWFEHHASMLEARAREKTVRRWHRDRKVNLIQSMNPRWDDLYESITH